MRTGSPLLIAVMLCVSLVLPAQSQEITLTTRNLGGSVIFVWRDKDAHDKALSLIQAGVHQSNPALLIPLVACIVQPGTRIIIIDAGFATHDIMVIEGDNSSCEGNIPMEAANFGR